MTTVEPLLRVRGLATEFTTEHGTVRAVDGVDFDVMPGQTLGIVGESGCGKSVTALSIMQLLPRPAASVVAGSIRYGDVDLARVDADTMHRIRGNHIGMIFQEPMTALNPVQRVGRQIGESLRLHQGMKPNEALRRSVELLEEVGIPAPERRIGEYPHQLSGGMRQRVMIAMALACRPDLLIADEPTTALDVTVQAQILELLATLQQQLGMAVIMITHDLGVIAETCDAVVVMYAGRVVERASASDLFNRPSHPYTRGLLASIPRLDTPRKTVLATIPGMVPTLADMPSGCRFANRCDFATAACRAQDPVLEAVAAGHDVACLRWRELDPVHV